jgi:hypothetical protein
MEPSFNLPKKRQPSLTPLGGNVFKFQPSVTSPVPSLNFYSAGTSTPSGKADLSGLSFESIQLPTGKKFANIDVITSTEYDSEGRLREFAGQDESKHYSLHDIYRYRKVNFYPKGYKEGMEGKKTLKKVAEHYSINREKVSSITESYFCYTRKNYPERAIPYRDELSKILKIIHLKRGVHLTMAKCVDRACELRVYWPGYLKDIRQYLLTCSCMQVSKLWCK